MTKNNRTYRWAVGIALFTAAFLVWAIGALGVIAYEGFRGDMMYLGVLAVLVVGAAVARFRARGMARALFATAVAQALVAVVALLAGMAGERGTSALEIVGVNGMFVALFCLSGWVFRHAAAPEKVPA
ncbi:hypothetical protein FE374_00690 [Georgenia yuyongxinii]|uniref:Uncharacterized protein n=1 Tax=Georgenia yuyongxinii TaxID=2589797 RepID=A0A5B8BY90_9MICO|nr:hypothetical protein [Georgenia yuyongxinii]QDC23339.1 hypothetical protein FE374_00690 [Georgenia yuyongxinii]